MHTDGAHNDKFEAIEVVLDVVHASVVVWVWRIYVVIEQGVVRVVTGGHVVEK